jgi:CelD/BcsL family acetyltransferase involved in cellulose biosynthesis/ribosomal protein S18 acetylase RimI-like enzyme
VSGTSPAAPRPHVLRRLASDCRQKGVLPVVADLWADKFVFERLRWFCGDAPPLPASAAEGPWRLASAPEAEAWVFGRPRGPEDRRMYEVALANGHSLFLTEVDGRLVGSRWVGVGWTYFPGPYRLLARFPPDLGYFYDLWVDPDFRGRGLGAAGVRQALSRLPSMGLRRCAAMVALGNLPSRRLWTAVGVPSWDATGIVVAGRPFWPIGDPWPRLGADVVRDDRRTAPPHAARARGTAVHARWIGDPEEWRAARGGWDDLVTGSERPSVFSTWDFLESCWLCFARPLGNRLAVVAAEDGGRAIAVAPLRVSRRRRFGIPLRRLSPLAAWESDRPPWILPRGREKECARAILAVLQRQADRWDYFELDATDETGPLADAVREWARSWPGLRLLVDPAPPSPCIGLTAGTDPLAALAARSRKSVRRCRRQLEERGPIALEVFEAPDEMERALAAYLDVEGRSWKRGAGQGVGKDRRNQAFYRALLPRLAAQGRAVVAFLRQGERRLAANIDFRLGSTVYGSQTTYDRDYARYSPGNVLMALALEWYAARGVSEYELFARFPENKRRWAGPAHARASVRLRVLQLEGPRRWLTLGPSLVKSWLVRGGADG